MIVTFVEHEIYAWDLSTISSEPKGFEVLKKLFPDLSPNNYIVGKIYPEVREHQDLPTIPPIGSYVALSEHGYGTYRIENIIFKKYKIENEKDPFYCLNEVDNDIICIYSNIYYIDFIKYMKLFTHEFDEDADQYKTVLNDTTDANMCLFYYEEDDYYIDKYEKGKLTEEEIKECKEKHCTKILPFN